jgi:hypothetical protein
MDDLIRVTERLAPLDAQVNRATAVGNGDPQALKAPHYLGSGFSIVAHDIACSGQVDGSGE